jgi:hypothetical protein
MKNDIATKMSKCFNMNNIFRKVEGVVVDFQSGMLGIETEGGILTWNPILDNNSEIEIVELGDNSDKTKLKTKTTPTYGKTYTLTENPFAFFSFPVPAFAIRTSPDKIVEGDIVILNDALTFCIGKNNNGLIKVVRPSGSECSLRLKMNPMMGQGIMVVKNMFSMMTGNDPNNSAGGMNPLMMMMLMGEENSESGDDMMGMFGGNKDKMGMMIAMMCMSGSGGGMNMFGGGGNPAKSNENNPMGGMMNMMIPLMMMDMMKKKNK